MRNKTPTPKLVVSDKLGDIHVDLAGVAEAMKALGVSEQTIQSTTIYVDSYPHLTILGSVWPRFLAWLRYPRLAPRGHVVRLSSKMFFLGPTDRTINHTLIHEIEHVAQIERKDTRILIGYLTNLVFLLAGIALGLTNKSDVIIFKVLIIFITALFGLRVGYMFSLHEMQARKVSADYKLPKKLITRSK